MNQYRCTHNSVCSRTDIDDRGNHAVCGSSTDCEDFCSHQSERDEVLDELRTIKEYDHIRFHQKHTLPKSWVEVKVTGVAKGGKRIGISGKLPGEGCTTEMWIDLSDVRQVCRWIELRQAGEPDV